MFKEMSGGRIDGLAVRAAYVHYGLSKMPPSWSGNSPTPNDLESRLLVIGEAIHESFPLGLGLCINVNAIRASRVSTSHVDGAE